VWKHMRRRGWPVSPWTDLQITEVPKKAKQLTSQGTEATSSDFDEDEDEDVRPFTNAEAVRIFALPAPKDKRKRKYTRPLFRELYALGFITGMRLNEIASLRPVDVEKLDEKWRVVTVTLTVAKTEAGARRLPICHPVAVAILDARVAAQKDPKGRLYKECHPGGPDNKPSWHVGKAMSRERLDERKLGLNRAANFHSTRRSFATLMENSTVIDNIGQQRYMGHDIPNQMNGTYSGGTGVEKLKAIVLGLAYPAEVEEALRLAAPVVET
jgi:integrase